MRFWSGGFGGGVGLWGGFSAEGRFCGGAARIVVKDFRFAKPALGFGDYLAIFALL